MRPLGQADRLVHEEAHPILPQLVEPILEGVDCTRVYDYNRMSSAIFPLPLAAIYLTVYGPMTMHLTTDPRAK